MKAQHTSCNSCGMPLVKKSDHALGDESIPYCTHCTNEDGSLKPFEEVTGGVAAFLMETQGMDPIAAKQKAEETLRDLPAWNQPSTP